MSADTLKAETKLMRESGLSRQQVRGLLPSERAELEKKVSERAAVKAQQKVDGRLVKSPADVMKELTSAQPSWKTAPQNATSLAEYEQRIKDQRYTAGQQVVDDGQKNGQPIEIYKSSPQKPGGGSGAEERPLQLYLKTGSSESSPSEVWIRPGTVNGQEVTEDNFEGERVATGGAGQVWVEVAYSDTTGEISGVTLQSGATAPASSTGKLVHYLGAYNVSDGAVNNSSYGPLYASICRNWFAADPPYSSASWIGQYYY